MSKTEHNLEALEQAARAFVKAEKQLDDLKHVEIHAHEYQSMQYERKQFEERVEQTRKQLKLAAYNLVTGE